MKNRNSKCRQAAKTYINNKSRPARAELSTIKLRGHNIEKLNGKWVYSDTKEITAAHWGSRPCGFCGKSDTPQGHDGCLGTLPGVMNACCGHGEKAAAYIQWPDGSTVQGPEALNKIEELKSLAKCTQKI